MRLKNLISQQFLDYMCHDFSSSREDNDVLCVNEKHGGVCAHVF